METIRMRWLGHMLKIAGPVMDNLARERLKETIPTDFHPDRAGYISLEAFGRTLCGIAPWLALENLPEPEKSLQTAWRKKVRDCISNAVNPTSRDFMNFGDEGGQPLVDAAFLAHAILRAQKQLFFALEPAVQSNLIAALKNTRHILPGQSNWLLFSAMVEAALLVMDVPDYDSLRIDYALQMFENWYKGDGVYGDGPAFHWDYYNSFVIHPMYVDILRVVAGKTETYAQRMPAAEARAARYAAILERMIAPDGSYPIIGRSVTYRFGAFQLLSQAALEHFLPAELPAAQVRSALTAVLERTLAAPGTFDEAGWLRPGVYGFQPELAEGYISIGSLYLCCAVFLPLGLPEADAFWQGPDCPWTSKRLWNGDAVPIDHAL